MTDDGPRKKTDHKSSPRHFVTSELKIKAQGLVVSFILFLYKSI